MSEKEDKGLCKCCNCGGIFYNYKRIVWCNVCAKLNPDDLTRKKAKKPKIEPPQEEIWKLQRMLSIKKYIAHLLNNQDAIFPEWIDEYNRLWWELYNSHNKKTDIGSIEKEIEP